MTEKLMTLQERFCTWCKYGLNCKADRNIKFEGCPKELLDEAAASYPNHCPYWRLDVDLNIYGGLVLCSNCCFRKSCAIPEYKEKVFGVGEAGPSAPLHSMIGLIPKLSPEDAKRIREGSGRESGSTEEIGGGRDGPKGLPEIPDNARPDSPSQNFLFQTDSTTSQSRAPAPAKED